LNTKNLQLNMINNRGIKVWPQGVKETFCTDHWRCRFTRVSETAVTMQDILEVLTKAAGKGIEVIKTENLYYFDGVRAFSV
jgi:isocitrate dehydrogenase